MQKIRNLANATDISIHEIDPYEGILLAERNFKKIVALADEALKETNDSKTTKPNL